MTIEDKTKDEKYPLVGAENNKRTDTRTATEKIYKNNNQMTYNSHQKVDGPRNETKFLYRWDFNTKPLDIKVGIRLNKDSIKEYCVKVGGEF